MFSLVAFKIRKGTLGAKVRDEVCVTGPVFGPSAPRDRQEAVFSREFNMFTRSKPRLN